MTNYNTVRDALGAAIRSFQPDMNVYYYVPRTLIPPAAIVKPQPHRTISYLQAQSSGLAQWHFNVLLVIGQVDEEAAQEMAGDLISPGSPLIQALNDAKLPNGYAQVVDGAVAEMMFDAGLHTYSELSVVVCS